MKNTSYEPVNVFDIENFNEEVNNESLSWTPFLRQLLICSGLWMGYFLNGLIAGAATVLIPQIRKEANSTEIITEDMASWISSVLGLAGTPWLLILPLLLHYIGRKWTFAFTCIVTNIGFIVFYCSTSVMQILVSEIILGITVTSAITLSPNILAEYSSPQYRGLFLTIKSATFYWGVLVANIIGTFYHWKNIGLVALICGTYTATILIWPDSPYWLASKGYYDRCSEAHFWLKGKSKDMEKELQQIINEQKKLAENKNNNENISIRKRIKIIFDTVTSSEYYKPLSICILVFFLYHSSGKFVCSIYVIDIVKKITQDDFTAYKTMLILDGVTVSSMYLGCILSRYHKRRTMLFITVSVGISTLFILSLYLYLIKLTVIIENNYVSISLLMVFTMAMSSGPIIIGTSVYGEVMPIRYKSSIMVISGIVICLIYTFFLKFAPLMFRIFSLHGTFLFYGVLSLMLTLLLYKYMPETKDKTLQEIQNYFYKKKSTLNIQNECFEGTEMINK